MISIGPQRRVFVSTRLIDFRKGVHGLVALVGENLKGDPYCGDVFVFRAKRNDRMKLLFFDGTGMVLATRWIEEGGFAWPPIEDGAMALTPRQFAMLLDGFAEWARVVPRAVRTPRKTA